MVKGGSTSSGLTEQQIKAINILANFITLQSRNALTRLSNLTVRIHTSEVKKLKLTEIPLFLGGLDSLAIGVHVPFHGDLEGNVLLLFPEDGIRELEGSLLGSRTERSRRMRDSVFSEIGNILTGTILTVLSGMTEKVLISSPPLLVHDMAGSILDTPLADVGTTSDEAMVIVFHFTDSKGGSLVRSVFIPGAAGIELLLDAAGRLGDVP
jgi:chemotaxis protein CheC